MSRVYEALRNAEREVHSEIAPASGESISEAAHPVELSAEVGRDSKGFEEARNAFVTLQEQFSIMAARFEASRGYLETLIADARRVRDSLEAELNRSRERTHGSDLEALRAAGKRIQAELGTELESLAQRVVERAEARLEEKTTEAFELLGQAVESNRVSASTSASGARRANALRQIQDGRSELTREMAAQVKTNASEISREACEAVQKQVDQAAITIQEWQDRARRSLEADLKRALEAFGRQVADCYNALLAEHRRTIGLWIDDLHARTERATRALSGGDAGSEVKRRE